jgi:hypothetical protein
MRPGRLLLLRVQLVRYACARSMIWVRVAPVFIRWVSRSCEIDPLGYSPNLPPRNIVNDRKRILASRITTHK